MDNNVIMALISGAGSLIGTLGGILMSNRLTTYRISQLEHKVETHNSVIERTYKLEGRVTELEHDVRDIKSK